VSRPSALVWLWRYHRVALIGMGLALAVALAFAVRLTVFTIYWSDPAHRDQRIEGWMTPGYIARSWEVDPAVIRATLALEPGTRPTLAQIAATEGVPLPDLIARLEAAIAAARGQ
jgi:hypothetical protein